MLNQVFEKIYLRIPRHHIKGTEIAFKKRNVRECYIDVS